MCVHIVMNALKQLCSMNLYKAENIRINREWDHILQTYNNNNIEIGNNDSDSETNYSELEREMTTETLVHGFVESRRIHDLQEKLIELAPDEGQRPLGIFTDKYAEEMSFPTLFFGNPRDDDITKIFSYHKIVQ